MLVENLARFLSSLGLIVQKIPLIIPASVERYEPVWARQSAEGSV